MHTPCTEEGQSVSAARTTGRFTDEEMTTPLLERVLSRGNLFAALERVKENRGAPGLDGMTTEELPAYLKAHWPQIKQAILEGTYQPQPVRRVDIPKANGKGTRPLGIPTCLDRLIQQAIHQVLSPLFEEEFLEQSFGFRPGKSAHKAIIAAKKHISEGYAVVVDIDLKNFFGRVCHDKLMALVARRVKDKPLLLLIRRFLESGVMFNGLVSASHEGVPQGGPLSPLLSNVMLHELDLELTRRGLRFCRYADDCNVYVRTKRAGERVFEGVTLFLEKRLSLEVNREKSAVDWASRRKFLGFSFTARKEPRVRIAKESRERFRKRVRQITSRTRSVDIESRIRELNSYLNGWCAYFALAETPSVFEEVERWIHRRLRQCFLKAWKRPKTRFRRLRMLGLNVEASAKIAGSSKGPWALSLTPQLHAALGVEALQELGLVALGQIYSRRRQAL